MHALDVVPSLPSGYRFPFREDLGEYEEEGGEALRGQKSDGDGTMAKAVVVHEVLWKRL